MKYGIISDVHANPLALETALADGAACGVSKWIFCGDVTGYGYDAATALKLVRERMDVSLMGNHDFVCSRTPEEETKYDRINPCYGLDRRQRRELDAAGLAWLRERAYVRSFGSFACSHGNFLYPEGFGYVNSIEDAEASFRATAEPLLFVGHSHHAEAYLLSPEGTVEQLPARDIVLRDGWRYLVNVGSVGYPRHDFDSFYCIFDDEAKTVTFRRLPFDLIGYAEKLKQANIPPPKWLALLTDVLGLVDGDNR